jgi:CheY-like chemotaxis protein
VRRDLVHATPSDEPLAALPPGAPGTGLSAPLPVAEIAPPRTLHPRVGTHRPVAAAAGAGCRGEGIRARKWILVADDDRAIRLLLVRVLTDAGYSVVTAEDGVEALDFTRELPPHLILLDLRMPRLSGVEFLARSRGIPIVVLSGFLWDLPDEVASQANVVARLEKPVSLDVLRATVERVLGS